MDREKLAGLLKESQARKLLQRGQCRPSPAVSGVVPCCCPQHLVAIQLALLRAESAIRTKDDKPVAAMWK